MVPDRKERRCCDLDKDAPGILDIGGSNTVNCARYCIAVQEDRKLIDPVCLHHKGDFIDPGFLDEDLRIARWMDDPTDN